MSARSFERLARFITGELGIKMPESKISLIQSRAPCAGSGSWGCASIDEYCEHLFAEGAGDEERIHFVNAITTNKTDFFREPQHFTLPRLRKGAAPASWRSRRSLWPACRIVRRVVRGLFLGRGAVHPRHGNEPVSCRQSRLRVPHTCHRCLHASSENGCGWHLHPAAD